MTNSYDEVPYESFSYPYTHPDHLAVMATLFGMHPTPINDCRVLELGCANGGNLIPMGLSLPESQLIGIDLSERQTNEGNETIKELGLSNTEIRNLSILDIDGVTGDFDYIIVHGVYSWVPPDVQEKILEICQTRLTENGIAYISYNTYPGWHFRGMIRDMLLYHTEQFDDAKTKIGQARYLLSFLSESVPSKENAYGIMLGNELSKLTKQNDSYVFHEHLEDANAPIYFHQFVERIERQNLQFLAESEYSTMLSSNFPNQVFFTLRRLGGDIVRSEQYMDFVRNRTFRQTLLCRKGIQLNRNIDPQNIMDFFVASPAKPIPESTDIQFAQPASFGIRTGETISPPHPLVKIAFEHLAQIWPQSIHFDDLLTTARSKIIPVSVESNDARAQDATLLASELLKAFGTNIVRFQTRKYSFTTDVSETPLISEFARHEARIRNRITSQLHSTVFVDGFVQHLMLLLDGKKNKQQLLQSLVDAANDGTIRALDSKPFTGDKQIMIEALSTNLEQALNYLSKTALLIG